MIEYGHFALLLAVAMAVLQIGFGLFGAYRRQATAMGLSIRAAVLNFLLLSLSFLALMLAFLQNDFSVKYVAQHANVYLPWYYKLSATWSGHEGSLLLWVWILSGWGAMVALKTTALDSHFRATVVAILGMVLLGFITFILLTSSPFERWLPGLQTQGFPVLGSELDPILQDPGLILHPPILYMGYVGSAVGFAFIVAALLQGHLDTAWVRWCRPWTMSAWGFLTVGIALGSWWAYYELGWGGFWFWDPVENASLMPWLAATALIHAMAVTSKRDVFKVWTAFLAIVTFTLSLIGTFLVRSGVLTSVHAFANDPSRGGYILALIGVLSGGAFMLLIWRSPYLQSTGVFDWVSREIGILCNNALLATACLVVFIGTLAPLFYEVMGWGSISVGAVYFNDKMLWLLVLILIGMTFAPYLSWHRDDLKRLAPVVGAAVLLSLLLSYFLLHAIGDVIWPAYGLIVLILTVALVALVDMLRSILSKKQWPKSAHMAMFFGHVGFLLSILGIVIASYYSVSRDVYVSMGDKVVLKDLSFTMQSSSQEKNALYLAWQLNFLVEDKQQSLVALMTPAKHYYLASGVTTTEVALYPGLWRDIYLALGEPQASGGWSVRLQVKPFIRWIWLGALVMALAACLSLANNQKCLIAG